MSSDSGSGEGTATPTGAAPVMMRTDGELLLQTLQSFRNGDAGRPLDEDSVVKARKDALELLQKVLQVYSERVAKGEVGKDGTAKASTEPAIGGRCPTGLLYGRVQSGKTNAMIAFTAAAIDNGFRLIVVLTSDSVALVDQTARRFGLLGTPIVKNSISISTWHDDIEHVRRKIQKTGLVLVCAKNQSHLATLVDFIQSVDADSVPALILDDEADQATLDTTVAAREAKKPNAPKTSSTIHRRTVRNDSPHEEGASIRESLPHNLFLQVTATPYALLLQNTDNALRPNFTHLLEPSGGYTGGEAFFSEEHIAEEGTPPIVFVAAEESDEIEDGATSAPEGLQKAICFFLLAAAAQYRKDPTARGQNFLCHTSVKTSEHTNVADLIREYLLHVDQVLDEAQLGEVGVRLAWAYEELRKTVEALPTMGDLLETARKRLAKREIPVVNQANGMADFTKVMSFIVGGNILGRGLTIENLLVTYYLRRAKVSQMDTVLQHARMFGYRQKLMPYSRVFLPNELAVRFHNIHNSERRLRELLKGAKDGERVPVETPMNLKATRGVTVHG